MMKKKMMALICAALMALSLPGAAFAAEARGSGYITDASAELSAEPYCVLRVEFDIWTVPAMTELGVSKVVIYGEQSDGSYRSVYTFNYTNSVYYDSMMGTNSSSFSGELSHYGVPGTNYYAECTFYARNSAGSQTVTVETEVVTCLDNVR